MRFLRRSLLGLFLLAATLGLLFQAGATLWGAAQSRMNAEPRSFPQRERTATVVTQVVEPVTLTPVLTVFGELRSTRTLTLRAPTGGTVETVAPEMVEGGVVAAGTTLFSVDPVEAEGLLASARADLSDAEADGRDAERALVLAEDELAAAEAQATLREQALTRARDLAERGITVASDLEAAELAASTAAAQVLAAREAVAQAQTRIDLTGTEVARRRIAVADAERTLGNVALRAPFGGRLSGVTLAPGARITANEEVAQLVDPDALEVAFRVSTEQYGRLTQDGSLLEAPVSVALEAGGFELTATGRITREAATVGEGQTGRLIFAALGEAAGLRPGDFVTVRIEEPALDGVALLPATAVGAGDEVLAVTEEDRLALRPVEVLRRQGDDLIVAAADLAGTEVVTERSPLLGAGLLIERAAPDGETAAAAPGGADAAPGDGPDSAAGTAAAGETIALDPERRARLRAFVVASEAMPEEARSRVLAQLDSDEVPAELVASLEDRMGG
ncbi:efflux RND transporter periplasmic adaptor subunit [Wenxinia saemankumensis]|uniref:HlyD family secretion protein n=1 Tax=Wenxinia saemankumensis TaxID=1447782 RepID=A0A1M6CPM5_9RHOB|nr:HlyD family efflux transporter periplasmic adaptor subunit [Wenxinia saemankumensis]SHI62668.1 HlyD family secretion protein [Wenxinia saemankumensis]